MRRTSASLPLMTFRARRHAPVLLAVPTRARISVACRIGARGCEARARGWRNSFFGIDVAKLLLALRRSATSVPARVHRLETRGALRDPFCSSSGLRSTTLAPRFDA